MKLAFLAARPPYPANAGGRIRTFHLLKEISRTQHVTRITATEGRSDETALSTLREAIPQLRRLSVSLGIEGPRARYVRALRNPIDKLPYTWARYRHPRFMSHVRQALTESRYDIVHCDHVQIAHTLDGLVTALRLLNAHNGQ